VIVRTPSKLPPEAASRVAVHTVDLDVEMRVDLLTGYDAVINCAGHVAGGDTLTAPPIDPSPRSSR
jgi:hypothetical protein